MGVSETKIGIIGLGYVGLPLGREFVDAGLYSPIFDRQQFHPVSLRHDPGIHDKKPDGDFNV